MKCDRCDIEISAHVMSFFNTDILCIPCSIVEQAHPEYQKAKADELSQVQKGNFNYAGIGKPSDL